MSATVLPRNCRVWSAVGSRAHLRSVQALASQSRDPSLLSLSSLVNHFSSQPIAGVAPTAAQHFRKTTQEALNRGPSPAREPVGSTLLPRTAKSERVDCALLQPPRTGAATRGAEDSELAQGLGGPNPWESNDDHSSTMGGRRGSVEALRGMQGERAEAKGTTKKAEGKGDIDTPNPFDRLNIPQWQPCSTHDVSNGTAAIKVVSYNILAQVYVRKEQFPGSPSPCLKWKPRLAAMKELLVALDADILCLQEVDEYQSTYAPLLAEHGYGSIYVKRPGTKKDGSAVFFKTSKFEAVAVESVDYNFLAQAVLNARRLGHRDAQGLSPSRGTGNTPLEEVPTGGAGGDIDAAANLGFMENMQGYKAAPSAGVGCWEAAREGSSARGAGANAGADKPGTQQSSGTLKVDITADASNRGFTRALLRQCDVLVPTDVELSGKLQSLSIDGGSTAHKPSGTPLPGSKAADGRHEGSGNFDTNSPVPEFAQSKVLKTSDDQHQGKELETSDDMAPSGGPISPQSTAEADLVVRYTRNCVGVMGVLKMLEESNQDVGNLGSGGGRHVLVCSTHLFWDPSYLDVKLAQAKHLRKALANFSARMRNILGISDLPVIIGGDFNVKPDVHVYGVMAQNLNDEGAFGIPFESKDKLLLQSAYVLGCGHEPETTTFVKEFEGTIDYIFVSKLDFVRVSSTLMLPKLEELRNSATGLPNEAHPSDHLPIGAVLEILF